MLQGCPLSIIRDQRAQTFDQRVLVARIKEVGGAIPQFTKGRDISEHQRASGSGGLQHGKPKRLVKRRAYENRSRSELAAQLFMRQLSEELSATADARWA